MRDRQSISLLNLRTSLSKNVSSQTAERSEKMEEIEIYGQRSALCRVLAIDRAVFQSVLRAFRTSEGGQTESPRKKISLIIQHGFKT